MFAEVEEALAGARTRRAKLGKRLSRGRVKAAGSLRERVAQWWDLPSIDREYADFLDRYAGARTKHRAPRDSARAAFVRYVPMLTEWRRLPYLDPGLPLDLLPRRWNGSRAAELFADLDAVLRGPARDHALATIHAP